MRQHALASVLALVAFASTSPAAASVSDFRLPTERPTQQPPPDLQGPVAPDVPASRRRPAAPAPSPVPSASEPPAAQQTVPQIEVPTGLQAAPARPIARATPERANGPAEGDEPIPERPAAEPSEALADGTPTLAPPLVVDTDSAAEPTGDGSAPWWLGALALVLAAFALAGWIARRRLRKPAAAATAPRIEKHRANPAPAPSPMQPTDPLQISLEPVRLSLTLVNATLAYRLELANCGSAALTGLTVGADMIAAHASLSREEQLSGPRSGNGHGGAVERIDRLDPGERRVVEGEFRLPFPQIVPIRHGNAALLLPLARFRVEADGALPMVRTFVVGQPGQGDGLQPFRLDLGPRVYPDLAHHSFA